MSTQYVYYREIYDVNGLFIYIKSTLSTITSISYDTGTITTYWPSALSGGNKTILDGLIVSYSNPQVTINQNNFRNISVGNSTTSTLLANAAFTGSWEDVSDYALITIILNSDKSSNGAGLILQFSTNGINIDFADTYFCANGGQTFSSITHAKYFRLYYLNGTENQTYFRAQTIYHYYKPSDIVVLNGETSMGTIVTVGVNSSGGMKIDAQKTAFDQLSVEQLYPLVQNDYTYAINTETSSTTVTGSGTVVLSTNTVLVNSGAATTSSAILTSKKNVKYRIGQGIRVMVTPIFTAGVVGNVQLCGVGSSNDGFFFGYNGTSFGVMRRSAGVDNWIPQTTWNVDKMDGAGISRMILNPQLGNIYMIQFQWLGYGMISFGIEDPISGTFQMVHNINFANSSTTTSLQFPYLNCWASSTNTTNATNIPVNVCCFSAFVEGVPTFNGPKFSVDNNKTLGTNVLVPLITIRNKSTFASKTNRISIYIRNLSASTDSRTAVCTVFKNPTLNSAVYTDINTNNSCVEYNTAATTISGGSAIWTFCLGNSTGMNQLFNNYEISLEPGETLSWAARIPTAANTVVCTAFNWVEDS